MLTSQLLVLLIASTSGQTLVPVGEAYWYARNVVSPSPYYMISWTSSGGNIDRSDGFAELDIQAESLVASLNLSWVDIPQPQELHWDEVGFQFDVGVSFDLGESGEVIVEYETAGPLDPRELTVEVTWEDGSITETLDGTTTSIVVLNLDIGSYSLELKADASWKPLEFGFGAIPAYSTQVTATLPKGGSVPARISSVGELKSRF